MVDLRPGMTRAAPSSSSRRHAGRRGHTWRGVRRGPRTSRGAGNRQRRETGGPPSGDRPDIRSRRGLGTKSPRCRYMTALPWQSPPAPHALEDPPREVRSISDAGSERRRWNLLPMSRSLSEDALSGVLEVAGAVDACEDVRGPVSIAPVDAALAPWDSETRSVRVVEAVDTPVMQVGERLLPRRITHGLHQSSPISCSGWRTHSRSTRAHASTMRRSTQLIVSPPPGQSWRGGSP